MRDFFLKQWVSNWAISPLGHLLRSITQLNKMTSVLRLFLDRESTSVLRTLSQQFETVQKNSLKKENTMYREQREDA